MNMSDDVTGVTLQVVQKGADVAAHAAKELIDLITRLLMEMNRRREHGSTVTEVICATDADREGECIFRYVYYLAGCKKPFTRLWVSSLEESAIKDGFAKMQTGSAYDSLYQAGFCRNKADWLIGMNGSRLFSIRYHSRLNLGRVQTPTLAMIVQRDYDVAHFVKQKYFTVLLDCGTFTAESERIDEESKAAALAQACNGKTAVLSELKKEIKTDNPPKLYDLTTLQRDANKHFGYTAKQTLDALQALYEAKLATYFFVERRVFGQLVPRQMMIYLFICKAYSPVLKHCWNSYNDIAGQTGMKRETVIQTVNELVKQHFITRCRRKSKNNQKVFVDNLYQIVRYVTGKIVKKAVRLYRKYNRTKDLPLSKVYVQVNYNRKEEYCQVEKRQETEARGSPGVVRKMRLYTKYPSILPF